MRGANILIPIAKHFNDDDFNQTFEGALSNTGSYGHNQILYAGDIGSFFENLYRSKESNLDFIHQGFPVPADVALAKFAKVRLSN